MIPFIATGAAGAKSAYKNTGRIKTPPPREDNVKYTWEVEGHDVCTLQFGLPRDIMQGKIEAGYDKKLLAQHVRKEEINPQQELNAMANLELMVSPGFILAGFLAGGPIGLIIIGGALGLIIKGLVDKSKAVQAPKFGYRTSINQQAYITLKKNEQTGKDELLYSRFEVGGKVDNDPHNPTVLAVLD